MRFVTVVVLLLLGALLGSAVAPVADYLLTWHNTGDDGWEGQADRWEMWRLTDSTLIALNNDPGPPYSIGQCYVTMLRGGNEYVVRMYDEADNWSESNKHSIECCVAGDATGDDVCDISDISWISSYLFGGGPPPGCTQ